jgi:hypothetical protein
MKLERVSRDAIGSTTSRTDHRGAGEEVAPLGFAGGAPGRLAVAGARRVVVARHLQQVGPHGHEVVGGGDALVG